MKPDAMLIQAPSIDFQTLLGLGRKVFDRHLGEATDACRRTLSSSERFLSCLAAIRDPKAPVGLARHLLAHVAFSVFIGADAEDMLAILERCPGMPAVVAETTIRGVQAAVITGTLAQWREAVKAGSSPAVAATVRHGFNRIYGQLCAQGLDVWGEFNMRPAADQTFYLEDKRGR
jgi:hypothetical protein